MLKVLYAHNSLDLGGAQSVRHMFLNNLRPNLLDVSICCLGEKGIFGEKIEKLGYKVEAFNCPYGLQNLSTTFKLYHYLKKGKFDIIHSSLFYANYHSALAASWSKTRFLITEEHGEHKLHLKKRHAPYRMIGRYIAGASNRIICCSDYVKKGVKDIYRAEEKKLVVIKNLVEDKRLEVTHPKDYIKNELGIPSEALVLGAVSSLYWVKNQKILIDALSHLGRDKIFLVIVGGGPLEKQLMLYAEKRGMSSKVCFTGWRKDVANMLSSMDIFILPSLTEGLPICLLEAMSMGLPCIASRVGGIEEVIEDNISGVLVNPGDLNGLVLALRRVLDNPNFSTQLGLSARRHAIENFSASYYVNRVLDLYTKLL